MLPCTRCRARVIWHDSGMAGRAFAASRLRFTNCKPCIAFFSWPLRGTVFPRWYCLTQRNLAASQDRNLSTGVKYEHVVNKHNTAHCSYIGPSIWLPDSFFSDARRTSKPVYSWVVDDTATLRRAQDQGNHAVISNGPLTIRQTLKRDTASCQAA